MADEDYGDDDAFFFDDDDYLYVEDDYAIAVRSTLTPSHLDPAERPETGFWVSGACIPHAVIRTVVAQKDSIAWHNVPT